jgi:hypothetical protein
MEGRCLEREQSLDVIGHSRHTICTVAIFARNILYAHTVGQVTIRTIMGAMPKPRREEIFPLKPRKAAPYEFVLDALAQIQIKTRPMFGCLAIYVEDKIVLMLREKQKQREDNGLWLATSVDHHRSLHREFPSMRSIQLLGKEVTGWQVLPADAADFEEAAMRACELILARDPRIGKVPKSRGKSKAK